MPRLCERPGCSVPASVAYGFEAERYLVWVESVPLIDADDIRSGVLCRRHADALTAPRGWWLDDRRVPAPRLFREPELANPATPKVTAQTNAAGISSRRRRAGMSAKRDDPTSELPFDELVGAVDNVPASVVGASELIGTAAPQAMAAGDVVTDVPDPDETKAIPWSPHFDQSDDLGGVLNVRSPLLSRAFRGLRPEA